MVVTCLGLQDYFYENFQETISISRPTVYANNVVLGSMYIDYEGQIKATNHKTGETAEFCYFRQGWSA